MHDGPEQDTDAASLSIAQRGNVAAFEVLVERHKDRVYGLALRMLRSEADAAEVTQETFLSAWQSLGEFRGEAAFSSWLLRIAANHALMRLRSRRVRQDSEVNLPQPGFSEDGHLMDQPARQWGRPADEHAIDRELGEAIQQATDALPEGYREVFLLKDVEGLSYEEIGELTGSTVAAVKSRLHRARLALRQDIDRFYREH